MADVMPLKLLVLSVGGNVGGNVLDALEGRRNGVVVVGVNSEAGNPRNFSCDKAYLAPLAREGEAYRVRLVQILETENPDLVIPTRDEDVLALAAWGEERPEWKSRFACGSLAAAQILHDKALSCQFAGLLKALFPAWKQPEDGRILEDLITGFLGPPLGSR